VILDHVSSVELGWHFGERLDEGSRIWANGKFKLVVINAEDEHRASRRIGHIRDQSRPGMNLFEAHR
jgi:hypothetical protein